jgi:hypothetical protein
MGFYPVSNRLSGLFHNELFFFVGLYPISNRLSGLFHKELFFWMDRHYQHNFFEKRWQV